MATGQRFSFVADDDCATVAFSAQDGTLRKMPRIGAVAGAARHRYSVTLTSSELEASSGTGYTTYTWAITGRDAVGTVTRVSMTNEIDLDRDGWTRTAGDVGECDFAATQNPGVNDVGGNGIDDDCDGTVDNVVYDDPDAVIGTRQPLANLGYAMAVGDVDGDGFADLQLATMTPFHGERPVYVVYGPTGGGIHAEDAVTLGLTTRSAWSSVGAGDADDDGVDDILWGDIGTDSAYLLLGPITADRASTDADATFAGPAGSYSGYDVDVVADFDDDGVADVVVGADLGEPTSAGIVYVTSADVTGSVALDSAATYTFVGAGSYSYLGRYDYGIGDATGDGIADLALATPYANYFYGAPPAVYLIEGGLSAGTYDVSTAAWATLTGAAALTRIGSGVAVGDYDGDGNPDVITGDTQTLTADGNFSGAAYAFLGPLSGTVSALDAEVSWVGNESWLNIGTDVTAADVDGDDRLDVLVGAPAVGGNAGAVYLQLGPASGVVDVDTLPVFPGAAIPDEFGTRVVTIPDWDGDGGDEIAIGAPRVDDWRGAVSVFGSDGLF